jgi:GDPmannose 4,6-dehydratase
MFGGAAPPQNEETIFYPRSPYACAKVYAYWMTRNYREGYNMFASNGICMNHESPRRGETFVTRKVTRGIARIKAGLDKHLFLGNLEAKRDWGFAPEYVEGMWQMLQLNKPADYVLGTGVSHTIREFVDYAFTYAGLDVNEHVKIDQKYFRPTEVNVLTADTTKAQAHFYWNPKIKFSDLVKIMVDADMRAIAIDPIGEGDKILKTKFKDHKWWQND